MPRILLENMKSTDLFLVFTENIFSQWNRLMNILITSNTYNYRFFFKYEQFITIQTYGDEFLTFIGDFIGDFLYFNGTEMREYDY